jgi:hypothetical protein
MVVAGVAGVTEEEAAVAVDMPVAEHPVVVAAVAVAASAVAVAAVDTAAEPLVVEAVEAHLGPSVVEVVVVAPLVAAAVHLMLKRSERPEWKRHAKKRAPPEWKRHVKKRVHLVWKHRERKLQECRNSVQLVSNPRKHKPPECNSFADRVWVRRLETSHAHLYARDRASITHAHLYRDPETQATFKDLSRSARIMNALSSDPNRVICWEWHCQEHQSIALWETQHSLQNSRRNSETIPSRA